jgi:hypothetical protein
MWCLSAFLLLLTFATLVPGSAAGLSRTRGWAAASLGLSAVGLPLGVILTRERDGLGYCALSVSCAGLLVGLMGVLAPGVGRTPRALGALSAALAVLLVLLVRHNPWSRFGVCFEEDTPGATSRFRTLVAVRCTDRRPIPGPDMGADSAIMGFEDLDGDGVPELLVMESPLECGLSAAWCPAEQTVRAFRLIREADLRVESAGEWPGIRQLWPGGNDDG